MEQGEYCFSVQFYICYKDTSEALSLVAYFFLMEGMQMVYFIGSMIGSVY